MSPLLQQEIHPWAVDLPRVLPHQAPFKFVDRVIDVEDDTIVTDRLLTEEEFSQYGRPNGESGTYPHTLLIEHAAQSFFLLAFHLAVESGKWQPDYRPTGFLTSLKHFRMPEIELRPGMRVVTTCTCQKQVKDYMYGKVTFSLPDGTVIAEGEGSGIFSEEATCTEEPQVPTVVDPEARDHFDFRSRDPERPDFETTGWFYRGHFPTFPCVPGCLMLESLAQQAGESPMRIKEIHSATFRRIMLPGEHFTIELSEDREDSTSFVVKERETGDLCCKGRFTLEAAVSEELRDPAMTAVA